MSYSSGWNVTGEDALKGGEDALKGGEDALKGGEDALKGGEDALKGGEDVLKGREDALKGGEDALKGGEDAGQHGDHQATFRQRNTRRSKAPERSEVRGVLLPQLDFSGPAVLFFWWILPLFAPFINIWSCRSCCHFPFLLSPHSQPQSC